MHKKCIWSKIAFRKMIDTEIGLQLHKAIFFASHKTQEGYLISSRTLRTYHSAENWSRKIRWLRSDDVSWGQLESAWQHFTRCHFFLLTSDMLQTCAHLWHCTCHLMSEHASSKWPPKLSAHTLYAVTTLWHLSFNCQPQLTRVLRVGAPTGTFMEKSIEKNILYIHYFKMVSTSIKRKLKESFRLKIIFDIKLKCNPLPFVSNFTVSCIS